MPVMVLVYLWHKKVFIIINKAKKMDCKRELFKTFYLSIIS